MNHKRSAISDARIDETIGNLLRAGVVVSSLIVLIGGGLYLYHSLSSAIGSTLVRPLSCLQCCSLAWSVVDGDVQ